MDIPVEILDRHEGGDGFCNMFSALVTLEGVTVVDPGSRISIRAVEAQGTLETACGGENWWRFGFGAHTPNRDVIGVAAVEGERPPVVAARVLNGECWSSVAGCEDWYAAELHR